MQAFFLWRGEFVNITVTANLFYLGAARFFAYMIEGIEKNWRTRGISDFPDGLLRKRKLLTLIVLHAIDTDISLDGFLVRHHFLLYSEHEPPNRGDIVVSDANRSLNAMQGEIQPSGLTHVNNTTPLIQEEIVPKRRSFFVVVHICCC